MTSAIRKLSRILLIGFVLVALALGYWGLAVRRNLLSREQNPRLVLQEQRILRGTILDRNDNILAASITDSLTGLTARKYPIPEAAPVIGYYSIRHGVGGIEASYDDVLRGTFGISPEQQVLREVLHQRQFGGDVKLTIDSATQRETSQLLRGRTGALVILSVPSGDILAMDSQPTFNPNRLEENWDKLHNDLTAPLLNRATQGLYQPGTILQSVVLGAALDNNIDVMEIKATNLRVDVGDSSLTCAHEPPPVDSIVTAFLWSCPGPFQTLGIGLGPRRLDAAIQGFGLVEAPEIILQTEPSSPVQTPAQSNLLMTAIGQSDLTVTPLQMAQVAAAFANHGEIPALRLVDSVRPPGSQWLHVESQGYPRGTISPTNADAIALLMRDSVLSGAAHAANLSKYRVHGHVGLAVGGPGGTLDAWFIGYAFAPDGRVVAAAVLLENEKDATRAAQIGGQALELALDNVR